MTTHALGTEWLTDSLDWDDEKIDGPFIDGIPTQIRPRKVVAYDDQPRHGFNVWVGKDAPEHSGVLVVGEKMFCSDHDDDCICKKVIRKYMAAQ